MYWSLPRGSLKRTVQSFESVFIVITIILDRPSNWNAFLAKIRWRAENCWRSKNKNLSLPQSTISKSAPADLSAKPLWSSLNGEVKVFVTPTHHFKAKFREMFSDLNVAQTSDAESKRWHAEPNMSSRPQQLNVAFWCAMSGCVISRKTLD